MWSDASRTVTSVKPFRSRTLVAARPAKPAPITTIRGCRWVPRPLLRGSSVLSEEISQLCMPSKLLFGAVWEQKTENGRGITTQTQKKTNLYIKDDWTLVDCSPPTLLLLYRWRPPVYYSLFVNMLIIWSHSKRFIVGLNPLKPAVLRCIMGPVCLEQLIQLQQHKPVSRGVPLCLLPHF